MSNGKNGKQKQNQQPKPPQNPPPRPELKVVMESYDILKDLKRQKSTE